MLFEAISLVGASQPFRLALRPKNHTKAEQFSLHSPPAHSQGESTLPCTHRPRCR